MYVVPLYFQITKGSSLSAAGFYLIPAVVGNTTGGLLTGAYIKKHGSYKMLTIMAAVVAGFCQALIGLRWTGHTGTLEALYIFFGGLGTGMAHSSTFIAVTAGTNNEEVAIAGAGLYLSGGLGSVLGVTVASSALRLTFTKVAKDDLGNSQETLALIDKALSDVDFVGGLTGRLKEAILTAYVWGFRANFCEISSPVSLFYR